MNIIDFLEILRSIIREKLETRNHDAIREGFRALESGEEIKPYLVEDGLEPPFPELLHKQ